MNNHSSFVIKVKMVLMTSIIVIFVNNHEIQSIGSTIVQISIFLRTPNAFLENIQISSLGRLLRLTSTNIPSLLLTRARAPILHVINVVILAIFGLMNVSNVISVFTLGVFKKMIGVFRLHSPCEL
jgi:hypothetical protein